jgi:hypothetical protein
LVDAGRMIATRSSGYSAMRSTSLLGSCGDAEALAVAGGAGACAEATGAHKPASTATMPTAPRRQAKPRCCERATMKRLT